MGCCVSNHAQSKTELFICRIIGTTKISKFNYKDIKLHLDSYFKEVKKVTFSEAFNFVLLYFFEKNSKDENTVYHENLFKNLIKLVFKTEQKKSIKKGDDEFSIYWLILLVFPLLKDKMKNNKIELSEKYSYLYELLILIKGKDEITYSELKEIMTIYMKGSLFSIFKSIYNESQNHILAPDLKKDLEKNNKSIFVETFIDSFIKNHIFNKDEKIEKDRIILEIDLVRYIPPETLFFPELLMSFNEYVENSNQNN